MNTSLISLELAVAFSGLALLLIDLWTPTERKRQLGYAAALALGVILALSFTVDATTQYAFGESYVRDALAMFFKRLFLVAGIVVLIMSVEFAERIQAGISEFYAAILKQRPTKSSKTPAAKSGLSVTVPASAASF